jgi:riboflavin kinase/FMN adenylyltransferase
MMNIGFRPTVSDEKVRTIEVHIFDFDNDIYDKEIKVRMITRIRDEIRFNGIDELREQLKKDKLEALKNLSV